MTNVINTKKAFTLTEIIISVVLISIIAMFAIPNYTKANQKTKERDIMMQLASIHAANEIYRNQSDSQGYANFSGDKTAINKKLSLNILSNDTVYNYTYGGTQQYTVTATWNSIVIILTEANFDPNGTNPCCSLATAGKCLIINDCL